MTTSWGVSASVRWVRPALLAPAVAGAVLLGSLPAAAEPTPTPSAQSTTSSQADVDSARAAEEALRERVSLLQEQYDEASARLRTMQAEVSHTAEAYAQSVADLERLTKVADAARSRAGATRRAAEAADRVLRADAAAAYMQGAGPMNNLALYLSADGVQSFLDLHAGIDAIGSANQGHLLDATRTASEAAAAKAAADRAQTEQNDATSTVEAKLEAAQSKAAEATELANELEQQQEEMVAELAQAQRTTVAAEQARQDELAEAEAAAARAAEAFAPVPGSFPLVSSGGSPDLTAAQLDPRAIARQLVESSFGASEWDCLDRLWTAESGWRWSAANPSSGAYGIPQALPGSKMASAGPDWLVNPRTQITWGLGYIGSRYGTPCGAWSAFQSRSPHWY